MQDVVPATNGRLNAQARDALLIGSWLLTVLAVLGVAGIVAGRVVAQRRRVGLLKAAVSTWTGVIDARHPLAVARALGATPTQAAMGLAAAQLLPAIPGVAAGILLGAGLFAGGDNRAAPALWMAGLAAGVLLCVTALTAGPALTAARHPVADTLRTTAT